MTPRIAKAAAAFLLGFLATRSPAAVDRHDRSWFVYGTPIRFKVRLATPPTHDRAGYIVTLPDGGLLPGPVTETTVVDHKGHMIRHGCLWHDPDRGLALVFEKPRGGMVYIHAAAGDKHVRWFAESGLAPSVVALTRQEDTGIAGARYMATRIPQGKGTFFTRLDRFSVGSIPGGLPGPFVDHVLGYVAPRESGEATISAGTILGAATEVAIDGLRLGQYTGDTEERGAKRRVPLDEDLHRVDMFVHRPTAHARATLVWNPPAETGATPVGTNVTVQSGTAVIEQIRFRDGSPVPAFSVTPRRILDTASTPVMLYDFSARTSDNPPDAVYTWSFGPGLNVSGTQTVSWLFEANRECRVELSVSAPTGTNACSYSFLSFGPDDIAADAGNPEMKKACADALLAMLKLAPPGADPTADWPPSLGELLERVVEPGRADELVSHIFEARWDALSRRLSRETRYRFEDVCFSMLCRTDPSGADSRGDAFMKSETDPERRQHWKLRRAELLMYYMDDLDGAARFARSVTPAGSPAHRRAQVRLGDIALLRGDLAEAERLYGKVQHAVEYESWKSATDRRLPPGVAARPQPAVPDDQAQPPPNEARPAPPLDARVAAALVNDDLAAALRILEEWEVRRPLDKIHGKYIVLQADLLVRMKHYRRADRLLAAYCRAVKPAPHLVEATQLRDRCREYLQEIEEVRSQ